MEKPPPIWEFRKDHTTGTLVGQEPAALGLSRYKNIIQILVGAVIIVLVAAMLCITYQKAKRPAYKADCFGRLRMLHQSLIMYETDLGAPPPAPTWRYGLVPYLDEVGGAGPRDDIDRVQTPKGRPRGYTIILRCKANQSEVPLSYLFMDREVLPLSLSALSDTDEPRFVDEQFHEQILILWGDGHTTGLANTDWLTRRRDTYQVIRDPEWRKTFCYIPAPNREEAGPATPPAVGIEETVRQNQQGGW